MPWWSAVRWHSLWQLYCEDFDAMQLIRTGAELCGEVIGMKKEEAELHHFHQLARRLYEERAIPTSRAKSGSKCEVVQRLGVEVNGRAGVVGLPREKLEKLVSLSLWLLRQAVCTRKTFRLSLGIGATQCNYGGRRAAPCRASGRPLVVSLGVFEEDPSAARSRGVSLVSSSTSRSSLSICGCCLLPW
jgi:hypothetical protein